MATKDYLKKYLDPQETKKRKKKVAAKKAPSGLKIYDDDPDWTARDDDPEIVMEDDVPVVVADFELDRTLDKKRVIRVSGAEAQGWTAVDDDDGDDAPVIVGEMTQDPAPRSAVPARRARVRMDTPSPERPSLVKETTGRAQKRHGSSPPRRQSSANNDPSPPRRSRRDDSSPPRRSHSDDTSPPRRPTATSTHSSTDHNKVVKREQDDNNSSPPRRSRRTDSSPPRRRNQDASPPRRHTQTSKHHNHDHDSSPPRRQHTSNDASPPRRPSNRDNDSSPPRRHDRVKQEPDSSPPRSSAPSAKHGLKSHADLKIEVQQKQKEEQSKLSFATDEMSGRKNATVHRDQLGRKVDALAEHMKEKARQEQADDPNEGKPEWGGGLVQMSEREKMKQRLEEERNMPFARYADDEELNTSQRNKDRWGDPMAEMLTNKVCQLFFCFVVACL
eukprot:c8584_g1_i2.p1 GENE.c8584_g1_i2~~c8584_g1_i2.p1  ORF type:complete len:455 (-),score=107.30 c8584_g1_i2:777-2111(-)